MIDVQVRAVSHRQMTVIGKCTPVEFQLRFDVTEIIYWFPLLRLGEVSGAVRAVICERIAARETGGRRAVHKSQCTEFVWSVSGQLYRD